MKPVDWMLLAEDGNQRRTLVNNVILSLRVTKKITVVVCWFLSMKPKESELHEANVVE